MTDFFIFILFFYTSCVERCGNSDETKNNAELLTACGAKIGARFCKERKAQIRINVSQILLPFC